MHLFFCTAHRLADVSSAVVIGHSLGTAYANYLNRFAPERVAAMAIIDPICCMLHQARTADAFVYAPVGASVKVACEEYYVRRELFTSNVIARHFRWHEATLWPSDCTPNTPLLIVLSEDDVIVPVEPLRASATTWNARARGVQVLSLPGLGHGGWLGDSLASGEIARRVRGLARRSVFDRIPKVSVPELPGLPDFARKATASAAETAAAARAATEDAAEMARTAAASAAAEIALVNITKVPSLPQLTEFATLPDLLSLPSLTKGRFMDATSRTGLPPKVAEQLWATLTNSTAMEVTAAEVQTAEEHEDNE